MHFCVNLKMKKSLCCWFTWIIFIELNFSCISVHKENLECSICGKEEEWEILRNGEVLVIILKWEVSGDTPLRTMLWQNNNRKRT